MYLEKEGGGSFTTAPAVALGGNWSEATTSWPGNTSGDSGSPGEANELWSAGPVDTDGDGIPDDYETLHCGGPTNCVAGADLDLEHIHVAWTRARWIIHDSIEIEAATMTRA